MPKPPRRSHQIAAAQELPAIHLLHSPINIMKENICGSFLLPVPSHHGCRENGGHSPRRGIEVTTGGVNHDDIPLRFVDKRGQIGKSELAFGGSQGPGGAGAAGGFISSVVEQQGISHGNCRLVLDVMSFDSWLALHDFPYPIGVLFQENGVAVGIEGIPKGAVVAEAEDEEIAGASHRKYFQGQIDFSFVLLGQDPASRVVHKRPRNLARKPLLVTVNPMTRWRSRGAVG